MSDIKNTSLATSLVSYWELEEASGTRTDSHSSNDLTDNNTVGVGTGVQGNAADFEASNSEYLSCTLAAAVTGDFSVSFWKKFESLPSHNTRQYDFFIADNIQFSSAHNTSGTYYLYMYLRDGSGFYLNQTPWSPSLDTWYFLTVTRKQSTGEIKFYVNGAQQGSTINSGRTGALLSQTSLYIGGPGSNSTDGLLDEIGFWSRELSLSEVQAIYNSGSGIPYDAGGGGATPQSVEATVSSSVSLTTQKIVANFPDIEESVTTASGSRATSHSINLPTGTVDGELLLMHLTAAGTTEGDAGVELATITTPTGWTQLFNEAYDGSLKVRHAVYYRTADGTEGSTVSVTTTGARVAGIVHRVSNWQGTPEAGTAATGNSTAPNAPSLTPSWGAKKNLWIPTMGTRAPRTVSGTPTDYSTQVTAATGSVSSSLHCRAESLERTHYATSQDPAAWTLDTAVDWVANVIAIEPADNATYNQEVTATGSGSASVGMVKTFLRTLSDTAGSTVSMLRGLTLIRTLSSAASGAVTLLTGVVNFKEIAASVTGSATLLYGSLQSKVLSVVATATAVLVTGSVYTRDVLASVVGSATMESVKTLGQMLTATVTGAATITKNFLFDVVIAATATAVTTIGSGIARILAVTAKAWVKMKESFWVEKYEHQDDDYHVKY